MLLTPLDERTQIELSEYQARMVRMSHDRMIREQAITGTKGIRPHSFRLALASGFGPSVHVDLRFTDYEGGLLTSGRSSDLKERLNATDIMLVTVDTPALIAEDGRWHRDVNKPLLINERLKEWADAKRRALVVFVPLKCEHWTRSGRAITVIDAVQEGYQEALATLKVKRVKKAVICPVESLGSHEFMHFQVEDEVPYAKYRQSLVLPTRRAGPRTRSGLSFMLRSRGARAAGRGSNPLSSG